MAGRTKNLAIDEDFCPAEQTYVIVFREPEKQTVMAYPIVEAGGCLGTPWPTLEYYTDEAPWVERLQELGVIDLLPQDLEP